MAERNWAGNLEYRATSIHHPADLGELRDLVVGARRIRALGSRHSFNDLADSEHELVVLDRVDPDVRIDEGARTVTFGAGMRYGDLAEVLQGAGWALHNMASLPHISVAGAVATGTHGSGDRNGTLSSAVAGLELLTAEGELVHARRGDAEFDGMVVALGALGIVTRLTLDIQPTFEVRQDVYSDLPWDRVLEDFDAITSSAYSVSLFTNWAGDSIGQVWLKSTTPDAPETLAGAERAPVDRHPLREMPATNATRQGGVPGPWNDRLPHFRMGFTPSNGEELQTEYLVPRRHAVEAIRAVRALGEHITPHLLVTEIRTMAADSLWLSGAFETDAVGIHFTWKKEPEHVLPLLPRIEAALEPYAARPHWGKLFAMDSSRVRTLYPRIDDFDRLVARFDPEGVFSNDYLRRVL
ncbi:xylitol oxidase [Diaminobutyricimonas aerilata]|uniref:Xylitol oxidase n=1 Tax=Diaminobutyricimonas aerilata TaxID=1162967 RepID=A0A2M9CJC5_9MICO|nr:D-arabinono-1,4-lactone oxidase [Diaminobutyricimonas aerilata]PJJ71984.1 xylitol oxidase [Diaminobutyricimonas aerilata]